MGRPTKLVRVVAPCSGPQPLDLAPDGTVLDWRLGDLAARISDALPVISITCEPHE